MKYKGIVRERKTSIKVIIFLLACYLLYREIAAQQWVFVPVAILVIIACFFRKEQVISEEGVDIEYIIFEHFRIHHYWRWDEITTLHADYRKARPDVMLHIGKDVVVRTFVMTGEDCQGAVALAEKMNPNIYIDNPTPEEQERRDQEILHRQEVLKAQRAAARKRKKK